MMRDLLGDKAHVAIVAPGDRAALVRLGLGGGGLGAPEAAKRLAENGVVGLLEKVDLL